MPHLTETSARVSLVAATVALLEIEAAGPAQLAAALGVGAPAKWPPYDSGESYLRWMTALLARHPGDPGWGTWYVIGDGELVGTCGFKGPPNAAGEVEIGYSVIAPRQRRGFASGAVDILLARAFRDARVRVVFAETLPDAGPSQAVLRRCGFAAAGHRIDAEEGEVLVFRRNGPVP